MDAQLNAALASFASLPDAPFAIVTVGRPVERPPVSAPELLHDVGATALVMGTHGSTESAEGDESSFRAVLFFMHEADDNGVEVRNLKTSVAVRDHLGNEVSAARLRLPAALRLGDDLLLVGRPGAIYTVADLDHAPGVLPLPAATVALTAYETLPTAIEFVPGAPTTLGFSLEHEPEPTLMFTVDDLARGGNRRRIHDEQVEAHALAAGFFLGRSGRCDWPSFVGDRFRSLSRLHGVLCASHGGVFYCDTNSALSRVERKPRVERIRYCTDLRLTPELSIIASVDVER